MTAGTRSRPVLIMLSGLPASGKSHLAAQIRRRYPLTLLQSDELRKTLFRRPVYTQQESSRLFAAIHAVADHVLTGGASIIIDATNLKEAHRRPFYDIAARRGARLMVVEASAPEGVIRRRLAGRLLGENAEDRSEAGTEVYEAMRAEAEPIRREHVVVDTSGDISVDVDKIVQELMEASG